MKVCIPVTSPEGLNAAFEGDFGNARYLVIVEDNGDGEIIHAVDRAQPELVSQEVVAGIEAVLCGEIDPGLLFQLQRGEVKVFGCKAESAAAALAQFRAGQLQLVPAVALPPEHEDGHHGCDGKGQGNCQGKGQAAHQCCGGKNHDHGHDHGHEHASHEHKAEAAPQGHQHGGCGCKH